MIDHKATVAQCVVTGAEFFGANTQRVDEQQLTCDVGRAVRDAATWVIYETVCKDAVVTGSTVGTWKHGFEALTARLINCKQREQIAKVLFSIKRLREIYIETDAGNKFQIIPFGESNDLVQMVNIKEYLDLTPAVKFVVWNVGYTNVQMCARAELDKLLHTNDPDMLYRCETLEHNHLCLINTRLMKALAQHLSATDYALVRKRVEAYIAHTEFSVDILDTKMNTTYEYTISILN